jgi:hypothetical protein
MKQTHTASGNAYFVASPSSTRSDPTTVSMREIGHNARPECLDLARLHRFGAGQSTAALPGYFRPRFSRRSRSHRRSRCQDIEPCFRSTQIAGSAIDQCRFGSAQGCDELHGGALNRLGNGLRIAEVVLLAFRQGRFLLPMRPSPYRSRVF